jgi:choline monooxygenase
VYQPVDIFDPALYRGVRRPHLEAEPLPHLCYTSPSFFDAEMETIFLTQWIFSGRGDQIPNAGDYMTSTVAGTPLVIVRGKNMEIRCFVNSCRHRGTRLVSGTGNAKRFLCPYHAWSFDIDGHLKKAPGMHQVPGFRLEDYGLKEIRCEGWGGFIWINLDDQAPPLLDWLGNLTTEFESYKYEDMVCTRVKEYDLRCNWKAYVENAMEAYHTPFVHKATLGHQRCTVMDSHGAWCALHEAHAGTEAVLKGNTSPFPPIADLQGWPAKGTMFALIYPGTMFGCTRDCMWWLDSQPVAADRTRVVIGSCFPKSTVARADFDQHVGLYYGRWDKSIPEDNWISELQNVGLAPRLRINGRLGVEEPLVHVFNNWVLDRVLG